MCTASSLYSLRLYIQEIWNHIEEDGIGLAEKKSKEYDIPIEKRPQLRKRMADEMIIDVGLALTAQNPKDMWDIKI